jgi:hypothetical protein
MVYLNPTDQIDRSVVVVVVVIVQIRVQVHVKQATAITTSITTAITTEYRYKLTANSLLYSRTLCSFCTEKPQLWFFSSKSIINTGPGIITC